MRILLIMLFFLTFVESSYSSEFTDRMQQNNPVLGVRERKKVFRDLRKNLREMKSNPTLEAEYYYQNRVQDGPCAHCPRYFDLISQVNEIVDKIPVDKRTTVSEKNYSLIHINRLKFLYFEARAAEENGSKHCFNLEAYNTFTPGPLGEDQLVELASSVLKLSNVTSIQYIPADDKLSNHYFYQGEGLNRDIVIEVIVYKNGTSSVKYHRLRQSKAKDESTEYQETNDVSEATFAEAISLDEQLSNSTESEIKNRVRIEGQETEVKFRGEDGKNWLLLGGKHRTANKIEFFTMLPVELNLSVGDGFKVEGEFGVSAEKSYMKGDSKSVVDANFVLTDHQGSDLARATVINSSETGRLISLMGNASIGNFGNYTWEGKSVENVKSFEVGQVVNLSTNSKLTTKVGHTLGRGNNFKLQHERNLNDTDSLILTINYKSSGEKYIIYQYKALLNR